MRKINKLGLCNVGLIFTIKKFFISEDHFNHDVTETLEGNCMLPSQTERDAVTVERPDTSSAGHLLRKPKKGFLNHINLVLSRFILSKL